MIKGKIAAIINTVTVIINKGSLDGVNKGMKFVIKLSIPSVVDPDDPDNILNDLYFEKGKIVIDKTYDRMAMGTIQGEVEYFQNALTSLSSSFAMGITQQTKYPEVDSEIIKKESWRIQRGDEVEELL